MYCKSLPPERYENIPEKEIDAPVGGNTDTPDRREDDQPIDKEFKVLDRNDNKSERNERNANGAHHDSKNTADAFSRLDQKPTRIEYTVKKDQSDSAAIAGQSNTCDKKIDPRGKVEHQEEEKKFIFLQQKKY